MVAMGDKAAITMFHCEFMKGHSFEVNLYFRFQIAHAKWKKPSQWRPTTHSRLMRIVLRIVTSVKKYTFLRSLVVAY